MQLYNTIKHPICDENKIITITGTNDAIERVLYLDVSELDALGATAKTSFQQDAMQWIEQFLNGSSQAAYTFPDSIEATPFRMRCLKAMHALPYGSIITYSDLAKKAGNPSAFRAAASACATNPLPLLIPCHRIINKQRGASGFAWGVPFKERLLALEQTSIKRAA